MITLSSTRNISTGNQEHEELEHGADHEEDQQVAGVITLSSTRNISTGNQEHEELKHGADHEEDQQVAGDDHPLLHQEHQYR